MSFIFSFFFFVLLIGLVLLMIVFGFLRSIFGGRRKSTFGEEKSDRQVQPKGKKKIFDDNEGEYVDFEEIND